MPGFTFSSATLISALTVFEADREHAGQRCFGPCSGIMALRIGQNRSRAMVQLRFINTSTSIIASHLYRFISDR
jgi:hypothetical protein